MYTVIFLEEADKELENSAAWYDERSDGLGQKFIDAVRKKLEIISEFPERYPVRRDSFRETPLKTFPYLIVYTFDEKEKLIKITSIFHTSRKPSKKYRNR